MKKEVTISISDELYQRAEAMAKRQRRAVADVLAESIQLSTPEDEVNSQATDADVQREKDAFIALHPTLLKAHAGEYVAIYNGQLVDFDRDPMALSERIDAQFPDEFVWIAPVKSQPIQELAFRSPRFE